MLPYLNLFGLKIPSYGLMMALAFVAAILLCYFRAKKAGLDPDKILNLAIIAILAGMAGANLHYIIVSYSFSDIIGCIKDGSFSVFKSGGLVFYGGFILAAACCIWYLKAKKLSISDYASVIIPSIPLAHAIGRVGCFLAGCCYGRVCDTALSVIYTNPIGGAPVGVPVFPVQLLEAALNLIIFAILLIYTRKKMKSASSIFLYLFCYSIVRFTIEYFRADEIRGIFLGLSTSQWISIGLFVIGIVGFILVRRHERLHPRQVPDESNAENDTAEVTENTDTETKPDGEEAY